MTRLLGIVVPRSLARAGLLLAVLALVTCAVTPLGLAALLLGPSRERAFDVAMSRAPGEDVDVTAYIAGLPGTGVAAGVAATRVVLRDLLAPLPATTEVTASSTPRELGAVSSRGLPPGATGGSGPRVGYLGVLDDLGSRVRFTQGRAPRPGAAVPEAALPAAAAAALHLRPGDEVGMGPEVTDLMPGSPRPVRVRLVGVFIPLPGAGWDRDLLQGAGIATRYFASPRLSAVPAFGPFVVDLADLTAGGSTLERLQVTAHPDLTPPARSALAAVAARLPAADARLATAVHGGARVARVETALPVTLGLAARQEAVTRAAVLVVVLLAAALSVGALALAGRLVGALRAEETELLASFGASRRQLLALAAAEALAVAALATLLAVPLAGLAARALTQLPATAGAGLAGGASVTGLSVLAVAVGASALAALLVLPALRPEHGVAPSRPAGATSLAMRSGADVLAAGLAVAGFWQLRVQPPVAGGTDAVRALAPVLCLVAGVLLALRILPPLLGAGDRAAGRSRALVLPLAAVEAARRPQATAGALIVALGTASGTFALATLATWDRTQHAQADLRVGTDLAVALAVPARLGDGAAVERATGGTVSPATRRPVPVGQWVGEPGEPPELVAVDTARAGRLLRGTLPEGRTWTGVGAALAPVDRVAGAPLDPGSVPTLRGTVSGGAPLRAVPRLVLQDAAGLRVADEAGPLRLDGRPHPLALAEPVPAGAHVVAVDVLLDLDPAAPGSPGSGTDSAADSSAVSIQLRLPGPAAGSALGAWSASSPAHTEQGTYTPGLGSPSVRLLATDADLPGAPVLRMNARVGLFELFAGPAELVATAFPRPGPVPVAVSAVLAGAAGVRPGGPLTVTVDGTTVQAWVAQVLPDVPSVPGGPAVLADSDLLSRALIAGGDLSPSTDAWWVGDPSGGAARQVAALGLGTVRTRSGTAQELTAGPLRVLYPVTLGALVPVALLLVLAGTALAVTADVRARALELARLRALGLRRRDVRRGLVAQHGALLVVLVALGAVVGWACARLLAPLLIRSDTGAEPVPGVLALWPWGSEAALLSAYVVGCVAVAAAVAVSQASRADSAHLRVGT